jgi:hypothetical protein
MHELPLRFTLALAGADEPPAGLLIDASGTEHRLEGWMQLSSALAAAMRHAAREEGRAPERPER